MKRRNKSWLIAALVALSAVMVLTGCSLSQVLSLTIVDYPATTYEVGTTPDIEFTVAAEMDNGETRELTYNEYSSVLKLSGFSTAEVGTFTATVTYRNVSATFDYEVVAEDNYFAGGVGTESNPYIINTVDQFKNINISGYNDKYFKLSSDIEIQAGDLEEKGYYTEAPAFISLFSGALDGNGYKITITAATDSLAFLFGELRNSEIKNVDIYSNGHVSIFDSAYENVTISDVNRYGEMVFDEGNNFAPFGLYIWGWEGCNFLMENCENHVNMGGISEYNSAFIGYPMLWNSGKTDIVLRNCVNYGDLTGQKMSAFFANAAQVYGEGIVLDNCWNEGKIRTTDASGYYFAISGSGEVQMKDENGTSYGDKVSRNSMVTSIGTEGHKNGGSQTQLGTEEGVVIEATVSVISQQMIDENSNWDSSMLNLINIELSEASDVAYAVVRVSYYAKNDNGTSLRNSWETVDLSSGEAHTTRIWKTGIKVGETSTTPDNGEWSIVNGKYQHCDAEFPALSGSTTVYVLFFDANDNLIAGQQV